MYSTLLRTLRLWPICSFIAIIAAVTLASGVGPALAENVVYDQNSTNPRTDTPLPSGAHDKNNLPQYGLSEPDKVWGDGVWPIDNSNVGYPTNSLFPWSSGSHNSVTVDGVDIPHSGGAAGNTGYVIGGLWQNPKLAEWNVVTVRNGASVGKIIGGAALGTAQWNTVYLIGSGTTATQVTGGMSVSAATGQNASYNRVFITDATSSGIVTGGWNASGNPGDGGGHDESKPSVDNNVFKNEVRINGNAHVNNNIYGGYNEGNSETYGNTVTIDGGTIRSALQISGGYSSVIAGSGTKVYGNTVTVTGGDITWTGSSDYRGIYGGRSMGGTTDVYGNTVSITGGTIHGNGNGNVVVSGGGGGGGGSGTSTSQVFSNTVQISDGSVAVKVAGGRVADSGAAYGNTVTLIGSASVTGDIYGAYDSSTANDATIRNNLVNLYGGTASGVVYGGYAETGLSSANAVAVDGGSVTGDIYGGYSVGALASGNSVSLYSGSINSDVYGGGSGTGGTAVGNRVDLRGATVTGSVYAGRAATVAAATNNAVNLYGGTVTESVYGDWTATPDTDAYAVWQGYGNTLNVLSGRTSVGGVNRFGAATIADKAELNVTGDPDPSGTLRRRAVFGAIQNDGLLSFYNGIHTNGGGAAYDPDNDAAYFEGAYSGKGAIGLEISFDKGSNVTASDRVVFKETPTSQVVFHFKALPDSVAAGYADNNPNSEFALVEDGGTLNFTTQEHGYGVYAYAFRQAGDQWFVGLTDAHTGEIGKDHSNGGGGGLGHIVITETFLRDNLENAVLSTQGGDWGIAANTGYSKQRFADSEIVVEGLSALLTVSYHRKGTPFALGLFADTFQGEFRAHNSFSLPTTGVFRTVSSGDLESYGGGISFQYRERLDEAVAAGDFAAWTPGAYAKALVRFGYSSMDFRTETLHPSSYAVGGLYYGATLGGGHVFTPTPRTIADLYGYAAWTSMSARDATDSLGQHIDFARANSLRFIGGARAAYRATEHILPYVGLGMEWETLGRSNVRVDGYKADAASLAGFSGLVDLGVNSKVSDSLFLDFRLTGSYGAHRGIGGMMEIRYAF